MKTILLIDFENIQEIPLQAIDAASTEVRLYVGKSQNRVPFELASAAQRFGEAFSWHKIAGEGKNNLDFHIAFELGHLSARPERDCEYVILSKDTGYDHLLEYARGKGIHCRRIRSLADLNPAGRRKAGAVQKPASGALRSGGGVRQSAGTRSVASRQAPPAAPAGGAPAPGRIVAESDLESALILNLQKIAPNKRPRSRGRLIKHLESAFKGKIEPEELRVMIDRLFSKGLLIEENRRIKYAI